VPRNDLNAALRDLVKVEIQNRLGPWLEVLDRWAELTSAEPPPRRRRASARGAAPTSEARATPEDLGPTAPAPARRRAKASRRKPRAQKAAAAEPAKVEAVGPIRRRRKGTEIEEVPAPILAENRAEPTEALPETDAQARIEAPGESAEKAPRRRSRASATRGKRARTGKRRARKDQGEGASETDPA
jgi:hypothetical protein